MTETKTDNELIAEFMGLLVFKEYSEVQATPLDQLTEWVLTKQIKYHTSWDWLMPVVEKISKNYDVKIIFYNCECACYIEKQNLEGTEIASYGNFEPHIENVYKAVVRFLKWYKEQKQ